jgi:hypothetical protein
VCAVQITHVDYISGTIKKRRRMKRLDTQVFYKNIKVVRNLSYKVCNPSTKNQIYQIGIKSFLSGASIYV